MAYTSIYSQIRNEVQDYTNNFIEIVYGYLFNSYETIKRCHSYYNSQFQDKTKISGLEKIFYNISKLRAKVASKLLKFDAKDIVLTATNPHSVMAAFLLQEELKQWNREHNVQKMFDAITRKAPIYGSVFIEKMKEKWDKGVLDLRRMAFDSTAESIEESRFVTYKYYLTDTQLRRMAKSNGWDKDAVEEVIRKDRNKNGEAPKSYPMRETNVSNIIRSSTYHEVWRRFGEVPKGWLEKGNDARGYEEDEMVRSVFIVANPFDLTKNQENNDVDGGTILYKSEWKKDWPIKGYNYDSTEGRLLGVGVIEDLFPAQERVNEMANQKRIAMALSALHIFQTQDPTIVQNILTDLQSGDVIRSGAQGGLTALANEERNIGAFEQEEARYSQLASEVSFVNSVLLGEGMSGGGRMTATTSAIMNSNSSSEFESKKAELLLVLKEYYKDMILPEAIKDLSVAHVLRFSGSLDDMNYFDNEYAKILANQKIINGEVQVEGQDDYKLLVSTIVSKLKGMGKERWVEIKDQMYKDVEFDFEFITKDEQTKTLALMQQSFQFLSSVAQNPALLDNPMVKPIFMKINTMMGINPMEIEYAEQSQKANMATQPMLGQGQTPQGGMAQGQPMAKPMQAMPVR
jgi:hypothetical protein